MTNFSNKYKISYFICKNGLLIIKFPLFPTKIKNEFLQNFDCQFLDVKVI